MKHVSQNTLAGFGSLQIRVPFSLIHSVMFYETEIKILS